MGTRVVRLVRGTRRDIEGCVVLETRLWVAERMMKMRVVVHVVCAGTGGETRKDATFALLGRWETAATTRLLQR